LKLRKLLTLIIILLVCIGLLIALTYVAGGKEPAEPEYLPEGCTSILIGKEASTDGSVMATHAADCGICDFTWHHVPAADHKEGSVRKIYHINQIRTWHPDEGAKWENLERGHTGVNIPQAAHTYGYRYSVFGYMNDQQVAMGEASIGCQRKMRNSTSTPVMDITMLTLLAMERSKTAREAIELMGSLGEKYGYGFHDSGEMLAVIDAEEAWIFEIMPVGPLWTPESGKPGAVWCAQRVPDDHVSVCPNESRIGEIDLKDTDHFLASPNVISYAVENGFYDPESGKPFNWKRAYCPAEGSAASTHGRRGRLWRFFDLVAPSRKFSPELPNMDFPFSIKPDKKLSVQDVMRLTRDKYQGCMYDPSKGLKAGPFANPNYFRGFKVDDKRYAGARCISVNNSEYTTLAQCRNWLPDQIGGILWVALGSQDTSCYTPIYAGVTEIPESYSVGDHWIFNRDSARWAFDYVDFHTQVVYSQAIKDVIKAREKWEGGALKKIPIIDKAAVELYRKDPAAAVEFITGFSVNNAERTIDAWWKLGDDLLVKYNHLRNYNAENRKVSHVEFPEWWNRAVVEHDKLVPLQPPPAQKKKK